MHLKRLGICSEKQYFYLVWVLEKASIFGRISSLIAKAIAAISIVCMKVGYSLRMHQMEGQFQIYVQPIADRVAQNLDIISDTYSTNQVPAHGIYD